VAEKRTTNRTSRTSAKKQSAPRKKPLGVLLWLIFIIVIAGLFVANKEKITQNIQNTGFLDRLLNRETQPVEPETIPEIVEVPPTTKPPVAVPSEDPPVEIIPQPEEQPISPIEATPPTTQPTETSTPENPPAVIKPQPAQNSPQIQETRDRSLYFMKLDNDGTIVRTKVSRSLPVSNAPMTDVLNTLIQGPNADERRKGLESLIPAGTEILSATIRGSTAYISFSEDFQFNTYGVEGYAAQLRQIVWTVTEFPNVNDVQILLEGRRIDYLGEGIWIGSPLSRDIL
jgi:spore germination protein GerM